jgi:hypothetical protein
VVVLSKRLFNDDGSFGGIVVMALDLAYFRELFEGLSLGANGVISLYSDDGVAYMRCLTRRTSSAAISPAAPTSSASRTPCSTRKAASSRAPTVMAWNGSIPSAAFPILR